MEANDFIAKLKANGSDKDLCDLDSAHAEYGAILRKLSQRDKGTFALNVLCILCRNLDKVASWSQAVSKSSLVSLAVDCMRETRDCGKPDAVKTLACLYHIHRSVRENIQISPELVLKLSYMAFEDPKNMQKEYCKTYWNILADRLIYIEKLRAIRAINILLPKLVDDIVNVAKIYDTLSFCNGILVFVIKKLFFLYNDGFGIELNKAYGDIFKALASADKKKFRNMKEDDLKDLYGKLNECIYVVADNSCKIGFKETKLFDVVKTCHSFVSHKDDMSFCYQNFFSSFCSIMTENCNSNVTESVISGLQLSCDTSEKLGYKKIMIQTYPYINQLLRLYIEYNISNEKQLWAKHFTVQTQENCLKLVFYLMKKLRNAKQLLKCDNCNVKTGFHDALRISFLTKAFITVSVNRNSDISDLLPIFHSIAVEQHVILKELNIIGCSNHDKCFKKAQTDIHNTAILLNKSQNYEHSIKLFRLYLKNEIAAYKNEADLKNISRGFYNKSICELDSKRYNDSLKSAFLSYLFGQGVSVEKHVSLVIDVKSKLLKSEDQGVETDPGQMVTVLDVCEGSGDLEYVDLKKFFSRLDLCALLKQEFSTYAKLWPSIAPVAGVWNSLLELGKGERGLWLEALDRQQALRTLYEVILQTASTVRTIHSEHYTRVVNELLNMLQERSGKCSADRLVEATLLIVQCEHELAAASLKYEWKQDAANGEGVCNRTVPQECEALRGVVKATHILADIQPALLESPASAILSLSSPIIEVAVPLLLIHHRVAEGLQMARLCLDIATTTGDFESYVHNASTILSYCHRDTEYTHHLIEGATSRLDELLANERSLQTGVVFICDVAILSYKSGCSSESAQLSQLAQRHLADAILKQPDVNVDLAIGRLLELQSYLSSEGRGPAVLSSHVAAQRQYLTIAQSATTWTQRRLHTLSARSSGSRASVRVTSLCARLLLWRRARAAVSLAHAPALAQGRMIASTACTHRSDAQVQIANRLKPILGLQPSNETIPYGQAIEAETLKRPSFTPKANVETMLEAQIFKKAQLSPSLHCVTSFKMAEFLTHDSCQCYACQTPYCLILACQINGLEASTYYRSKDFETAKNFFEGTFKSHDLVERKFDLLAEGYKNMFHSDIVDVCMEYYKNDLQTVLIENLIEASFFDLIQEKYEDCDHKIVRIQEILIDKTLNIDKYLHNNVLNLICASAQIRKGIKKPVQSLEEAFQNLELSPLKLDDIPKTPEIKPKKPPKITETKQIVAPEELPNNRRKVIKLNLDDNEDTPKELPKRAARKPRIPVPVTKKPVPEIITPKPKSKPKVVVKKAR